VSGCPVAHGYDPLEPSTVLDPYPVFNRLRDEGPVFYLPDLDHYIITRYDDIEQVLLDRDTWSAANASSPLIPVCAAAQEILTKGFPRVPTLNNADPPRHGPMRRSVLTVMTPRRLNALEPTLRAYAERLVLGLRDEPVVDLVDRLAFPFPGYAAFSLLGFPPDDAETLREWSAKRVLLTYGRRSDAEQVEIADVIVEFWRYCERHVAARRAERADDITSDLLDLADTKPDQLNDFDIVNMVYSMALAGHETTCNTIGNGLRALLSERSQWQRLVDDPALIPNAVEEVLRYDGPVLNHRRVAKVDTEVGSVSIPAGAKVMMCFASAAHDPSQFPDPDAFDVGRADAELHLAFGKGPHYCLGAALARLEVRIVLELLTEHTPAIELVPDQVFEYSPNALFRGLRALMAAPQGLAAAGRWSGPASGES
jgi:cytochrome P450